MLDKKTKEMLNPLLFGEIKASDEEQIKEIAKKKPKYKVGEVVDICNWGGTQEKMTIVDVRITYHNRLSCWTYGYKFAGYTGFSFTYVPEGYLRKRGLEVS